PDTTTLQEHTQTYKQQYNVMPEVIVADAGYGSEQNYQYLQDNHIENYVKYNYFDKDQSTKKDKKHPFTPATLFYNKDKDCYICPMGQAMKNIGTHQLKTKTGFTQTISR